MKSKYSAADYAFQFITVTAGVLIALLIDGLVEFNDNRELVAQARSTIAREIADNKKDLDATLSAFPRDVAALDNALKFARDLLTARKTTVTQLDLHYTFADRISSTGWRTAERTGALGYMDYAEVQKFSKVYDFQDLFLQQQRMLLSQLALASSTVLGGDFDPDKPNMKDLETFRTHVKELGAALKLQEDLAKKLAEYYDEALKP
jgi:hypothetical protein